MKKQLFAVLLALVIVASVVGLVACDDNPATYALTYSAGEGVGGGTTPVIEQHAKGEEVTLKANMFTAPQGKEFDGWLVDGVKYNAGDKITMPEQALTVTAQWKDKSEPQPEEKWTVIFMNGEATVSTVQVVKGQKLTADQIPSAPEVADDKEFKGWFNGADEITVDSVISSDITAIAKIEDKPAPQPVITDEVNAIILHESKTQSDAKIVGQLVLSADGTGYINIVNQNSGFAIIEYQDITYSVNAQGVLTILTAPDSKITVPVTGSVQGNTVSITIENASANGAKVQYKFESAVYKLTVDYGYEISSGVTSSVTYVPEGLPNDFTQVVAPNGKRLSAIKVDGVAIDDINDAKELAMPAKDVVISYVWEDIPTVSYKVTYSSGEGVGDDYEVTVDSASYKLVYNTITDFKREGYAFAGWEIDGQSYNTGATITLTGDVTVTAKWRQTFTVTLAGLDVSGVTKSANFNDAYPESARYSEVSKFTLPSAQAGMFVAYVTRSGFTLTGWTSSADGQTYNPGAQVAITQNTTFTAVWESNDQPTFEAFAGVWVSETGIVVPGNVFDIKRITIANNTATFDDDGYGREATLTLVNDHTATAKLTIYDVTLAIDEGTLTVTFTKQSEVYTAEFTAEQSQPAIPADAQIVLNCETDSWTGGLTLKGDGNGMVYIYSLDYDPLLTDDSLTYTLIDGVLSITMGDLADSVSVTASIVNRTVSVTFTEGTGANAKQYKLEGNVYKFVVEMGYEVEGNPLVVTQYVNEGSQFYPSLVEREGYYIKTIKVNGEALPNVPEMIEMPANDVTITLVWEETPSYTVTYKAGEGEGADYVDTTTNASYRLLYNTKTKFSRDGYAFAGWTVNGEEKSVGDTITLTGNVVVTARWNQKYSVTFANIDGNGIVKSDNFDTTYPAGEKYISVTLPSADGGNWGQNAYLTREGFVLKGWSDSDNQTYALGEKVTLAKDTTFAPVWLQMITEQYIDRYDLSADISYDGDNDYNIVIIEQDKLVLHEKRFYPNYPQNFALTSFDSEGDDVVMTFTKSNVTITVMFKADDTITFELDAQTAQLTKYQEEQPDPSAQYTVKFAFLTEGIDDVEVTVNGGQKVTVPQYTHPLGKTAVAWYDEGGNAFDLDTPITKNVTLNPKWNIRISFVCGDDATGTVDPVFANTNETITLPSATGMEKEGYVFDKWLADSWDAEPMESGAEYIVGRVDVTFTAQWKVAETTVEYTVNFDLGGGTGTAPQAIKVMSNDNQIELPDGADLNGPDGKKFAGWAVQGSANVITGKYTVTGDVTLVAQWTESGGGESERTTLADYIGTSSATAIKYGYNSLADAGDSKLEVINSSSTQYDLYQILFYTNATGITGTRYYGANKNASLTLYATQSNSDKASAQSASSGTYFISVSGVWCSIVFGENSEHLRTVTLTNLSTNVSVTWTEITA